MEDVGTIAEGSLKFREGKRWKQRWCILKKISPVADCLHVYLYKENKDKQELLPTRTVKLLDYVGLEYGFSAYKEKYVLSLVAQKQTLTFAFASRECMNNWGANVKLYQGKGPKFPVSLLRGPVTNRVPLGRELSLYVRGQHISLASVISPTRVLRVWDIGEIQRFGTFDGRLVLETTSGIGSEKGSGGGVYVFSCDYDDEILEAIKLSSHDALALSRRRAVKRWSRLSLPVPASTNSEEIQPSTAEADFPNRQVCADVNFKVYNENDYPHIEPYRDASTMGRNKTSKQKNDDSDAVLNNANKPTTADAMSGMESQSNCKKNLSQNACDPQPGYDNVKGESQSLQNSSPRVNQIKPTSGVTLLNNLLKDFQLHNQSASDAQDTVFATVQFTNSKNNSPCGSTQNCHSTSKRLDSDSQKPFEPGSDDSLFEELSFPEASPKHDSKNFICDPRRGVKKSVVEESNKPLPFVDLAKFDGGDHSDSSQSYKTIFISANGVNTERKFSVSGSDWRPVVGRKRIKSEGGYDNLPVTSTTGTVISARGYVNNAPSAGGCCSRNSSSNNVRHNSCCSGTRRHCANTQNAPTSKQTLASLRPFDPATSHSQRHDVEERASYIDVHFSNPSHRRCNTIASMPSRPSKGSSKASTRLHSRMTPTVIEEHHHNRSHSDTLDGSTDYFQMSACSRVRNNPSKHSPGKPTTREEDYVLMAPSKRQAPVLQNTSCREDVDENYMAMEFGKGAKTFQTTDAKPLMRPQRVSAFTQFTRSQSLVERPTKSAQFRECCGRESKRDENYMVMGHPDGKQLTKESLSAHRTKLSAVERIKMEECNNDSSFSESEAMSETEVSCYKTDSDSSSNAKSANRAGGGKEERRVAVPFDNLIQHSHHSSVNVRVGSNSDEQVLDEEETLQVDGEISPSTNPSKGNFFTKFMRRNSSRDRRSSFTESGSLLRKKSFKKRKSIKLESDEKMLSSQEDILEDGCNRRRNTTCGQGGLCRNGGWKSGPDSGGEYFEMSMLPSERNRSASVPSKEWLRRPAEGSADSTSESRDVLNEEDETKSVSKPYAVVAPFLPYNTPAHHTNSKFPPCQDRGNTIKEGLMTTNWSLRADRSRDDFESTKSSSGDVFLEGKAIDSDSEQNLKISQIVSANGTQPVEGIHTIENATEEIAKDAAVPVSEYKMVCYDQAKNNKDIHTPPYSGNEGTSITGAIKDGILRSCSQPKPAVTKESGLTDSGDCLTGALPGSKTIEQGIREMSSSGSDSPRPISTCTINGSRGSSAAQTTLRPRSGKEYHFIDRKLLTARNACRGTAFTFSRSTSGSPENSVPSTPSHTNYIRECREGPNALYMNVYASKPVYVNIALTPPQSPALEQSNPLLNYAEIDLSGTMVVSQSAKRPSACPTEYAMIDVIATEAVQRAGKEHAISRQESDGRRESNATVKERKCSSSSSVLNTRDRIPSSTSTGSET